MVSGVLPQEAYACKCANVKHFGVHRSTDLGSQDVDKYARNSKDGDGDHNEDAKEEPSGPVEGFFGGLGDAEGPEKCRGERLKKMHGLMVRAGEGDWEFRDMGRIDGVGGTSNGSGCEAGLLLKTLTNRLV